MPIEWIVILALFIFFDLIILCWIFLLRKKKGFSEADRKEFKKRWDILTKSDRRGAVIDADKLLHYYLKKRGYNANMGEIFKQHPQMFSDLNGLWFAHKLRNKMVHELDVKISEFEYKKAEVAYRTAFRDLGLFK